MSLPPWAARYIGLPFLEHGRDLYGLDCWGLVRLVLKDEFHINVPSYVENYSSTTAVEEIGDLVPHVAQNWQHISLGQERLGDVLVMRMCGQPMHVGLILGRDRMLHIEQGINSAIEPYLSARWEKRLTGIYRHKDL